MILLLTATAALTATACTSDTAADGTSDTATAADTVEDGAGDDGAITTEDLAEAADLGGDFDRDAMRQTMLAHGHDEQVAECMADGLTEQLLPYMYDEVIAAPTTDEVPRGWQGAYYYRLGLCDEN